MNLPFHRVVPLFLALAAAGCHTLPNVSRFSEAPTQLYSTVQVAGGYAVAEMAAVESGMSGGPPAPGESLSNKVATGWQPMIKSTKAVARYSDSLRALVESGKDGRANAREALGAVDTLVKSVASAYPAGGAVTEGIFSGVSELWGVIAQEIAARSLARVIEKTDPVIRQVATNLGVAFRGMSQVLEASETALFDHLLNKYDEQKTRLNTYESLRTDLLTEVVSQGGDFAGATNLLARWQWVEQVIASERQQPWYKEYMAEKLAIQVRLEAEREIVRRAPALIAAWAASHGELVRAIRQKGPPDFTELITLSRDLAETYEQCRARVEAVKAEALKQQL
jgi:hypothetical protein